MSRILVGLLRQCRIRPHLNTLHRCNHHLHPDYLVFHFPVLNWKCTGPLCNREVSPEHGGAWGHRGGVQCWWFSNSKIAYRLLLPLLCNQAWLLSLGDPFNPQVAKSLIQRRRSGHFVEAWAPFFRAISRSHHSPDRSIITSCRSSHVEATAPSLFFLLGFVSHILYANAKHISRMDVLVEISNLFERICNQKLHPCPLSSCTSIMYNPSLLDNPIMLLSVSIVCFFRWKGGADVVTCRDQQKRALFRSRYSSF